MKRHRFSTLYIAFILLFIIVVTGITGYIVIEGYSFIEAFFMTIITMATVGFGEVHPLSDAGRIFTSFLIIFSFGIFAYVVSTITRLALDGQFRNYYKDYKVNKRLEKLENHVIICGYGRNGKQATLELADHKMPFVVVEKSPQIVEKMRDEQQILYIEGDATQEDVLTKAHISTARALISTLPNDADNLYVVLTAREMNPGLLIISRASDDNSDLKLKRAGATNVIMPDKIGGQRMAKLVAQPDVIEFLDFILLQRSSDVKLEELSCANIADYFVNKSIRDLDVRNVSGANIVGLRTEIGAYIINPSPDIILTAKDKLFVLGTQEQIIKLKQVLSRNL